MSDKYHDTVASSQVITDDNAIKAAVEEILSKHLMENMNANVYKTIFNCMDLTTLSTTDSPSSVADFVEKVNAFDDEHPELPNVAAICVYPNFAQVVRTVLDVSSVKIACVSGAFPTAQSFPEVKITETALADADGADEIAEQKHSCRHARLKVILETGALKTAENIRNAAILSMYSGADFIKTSTGKVYDGATLEAAYVMAQCIKEYYEKTGNKVGFKASGGVSTTADAVKYYTIIKEVLGEEWLTNEYFRIGTSRLANNLLGEILGKETKFF